MEYTLGAMASFLKGPRDLRYAIVVLQGGSTVISPSVGNSSGSLVIFATTAFRGSNRTARNLRAHTLCRLQPNRQSRRYSDPCRVILSRISTPQARCRAELSLVRLCQSIKWRMACRRDYHAAGILYCGRPNSPGNFAILVAIRRASSLVSSFAADRRPCSSSK